MFSQYLQKEHSSARHCLRELIFFHNVMAHTSQHHGDITGFKMYNSEAFSEFMPLIGVFVLQSSKVTFKIILIPQNL